MTKRDKIKISSVCDADINDSVKLEIEEATRKIVEECSKKYMRNIEIAMSIRVK
ncbi:hypothetical protein [Terrisporobacter sp.]|uniref:hypothetical protein n=1 Tax=Terrisporobacter sp. TaxID=1965305 RepID=UPI003993E375